MGWAFNPQKFGRTWLQDRMNPRGSWNYDGEADLGNGAIFRTAATILSEDPIFGWFTYGGTHVQKSHTFYIIPKDGVLNKFWVLTDAFKVGITVDRDSFKKDTPIVFSKKRNEITIPIESKVENNHLIQMELFSNEDWEVFIDGRKVFGTKNKQTLNKIYKTAYHI